MNKATICLLMTALLYSSAAHARTTASFELTDGTVYAHVEYSVNHSAEVVIITIPESGQKTIIAFAVIKSIRDAKNKDIKRAVLAPPPSMTSESTDSAAHVIDTLLVPVPAPAPPAAKQASMRPPDLHPDSVWIEQESFHTFNIRANDSSHALNVFDIREGERNFRVGLRLGGFYGFPNGWGDRIHSAPGIDGQFLIGLKNAAIGLNVSHAVYDLDDDCVTITPATGHSVIDHSASARINQYHLTIGGNLRLGKSRALAFLEFGMGVYHRLLLIDADIRNNATLATETIVWEESRTEVAILFAGGIIRRIAAHFGIAGSLGFSGYIGNGSGNVPEDLPFPYIPPNDDIPDGQIMSVTISILYFL